MSRPAYPTQLRDHLGNEVRLPAKPFATGGEGAVFDVVGRPDLVAKLYSKPQSRERCDKLRAMAKLCSPDLLKIAAWPTATLSNGNPAVVEGILMPRIAHHKEIHHLYSVAQRKKDFPEADWGFLLHTARNCAIAFESVHSHGHVVGDVNQKNVMVSKKGIVALVDCDSFQVKEGNRIFRCGVGVPEYTPPELHGRRFTDLDRDENHDLFGLAVMVFHLLMMGRHPFAGVPLVNVDIPIEKAIQDGLYAYTRNPTKLKPPPHVPPLAMLDAPTRDLFERAFGSFHRPTATEWRGVLDAAMKGLQRCKNDPKHSYPAAAGNCPWCQLFAVARLMFFIPSQAGAGSTLRIEDIRHLIQKLTGMQLVFPSYARPRPLLPIQVTLPASLRAIQKPTLLPYPAPPAPVQKPTLVSSPPLPVILSRPMVRPLPIAPAIPLAPVLRPHPPAPVEPPRPQLHGKPPPPVYPPVPTLFPSDPFLARLCIAGALAGVPVFFIARPVGVIMMLAFGAWSLLMMATEGMRNKMAQESLKRAHEAECVQMNEEYEVRVQPIVKANKKLVDAWEAAKATKAAEHARLCWTVDEENRRRLAPWEAAKVAIEADYQRVTQEAEQTNRRILSAWEAENAVRQAAYDKARRQIEQENQRLTSAWDALTASRQAEYALKCREIDAKNRRLIDAWKAANSPWIVEQKRWSDSASFAEAEIKRLENEFVSQRSTSVSRFQQRKAEADGVLNSHDGARQDYERELRQAEMDSKKLQLDEHLDKSLIRNAKLKGITGDRIHALESFGVETAKDVDILNYQKVPGIGPVLSKRLFDWRDKLASSFRPQQGLPDSQKRRIATRYAPVLLPLAQAIQAAISDLEAIAAAHRAREAERVKAIAAAVQDLAVAEAYDRTMKVV
jgi:DNA-binding helix-hairpin-helix protein with protein kinase domain